MSDINADVHYKLGEMHGDIKATLAEAQRTNGRVTKIETEIIPTLGKRIDRIEIKIAYYAGGAGVLVYLVQQIIPKLINSL